MSFSNLMREMNEASRSIGNRRFQGWVIKNDDSDDENPKRRQLQRMRIRIPDLHDNLKDEDLPWFSPGNMPSHSGAAALGDHGPIPPVGSKVWVEFEGDTQYHGVYTGAVAQRGNKIPDFTGKGRYAKSYPHAFGSVDSSGSLSATDTKKDTTESTHVSGTSQQTDGKGNVLHVINGDAERKDNKDAAKMFPKGFNMISFGGINLWSEKVIINSTGDAKIVVAGKTLISAKGNVDVVSGADVTVSAKGKATVKSEQDAHVSAKKELHLSADVKIDMQAPSITSSVEIVLAQGKPTLSADTPGNVAKNDKPTERKRPKQQAKDSQDTNKAIDAASQNANSPKPQAMNPDPSQIADPSEDKGNIEAQDDQARTMFRALLQSELLATEQDRITRETELPSGKKYTYTVSRS